MGSELRFIRMSAPSTTAEVFTRLEESILRMSTIHIGEADGAVIIEDGRVLAQPAQLSCVLECGVDTGAAGWSVEVATAEHDGIDGVCGLTGGPFGE
jgi:hypothetical protein